MPLDLDDEKAIDYSSNIPFLPFEALGDYVLDILSYEEHEGHNGDGDLVTVQVVETDNATIRAGEKYVFYFRTDIKGDGKAFAAARLRSFVRAAVGVAESEARTFEANPARKALLAEDLSKGGNLIRLSRRSKPAKKGTKHEGKEFCEDFWKVADKAA